MTTRHGENPKLIQAQKDGKAPMEYLVYSVLEDDARVHKHGADKYGERNWREQGIRASTYEGAILRHFLAWAQGEDLDPDSGLPHLSHIRACCAVVLDSQKNETLIDDRARQETIDPGEYNEYDERLAATSPRDLGAGKGIRPILDLPRSGKRCCGEGGCVPLELCDSEQDD